MKALEILKACRERGQKRAGGISLYEAIAELEEAMKPKSCDGCEYCTKVFSYTYPLCTKDEQYQFQIHNKELLYCNRYKPKETK